MILSKFVTVTASVATFVAVSIAVSVTVTVSVTVSVTVFVAVSVTVSLFAVIVFELFGDFAFGVFLSHGVSLVVKLLAFA